MKHLKNICRSKSVYLTPDIAKKYAMKYNTKVLDPDKIQHPYKCNVCGLYHLSSIPQNKLTCNGYKVYKTFMDANKDSIRYKARPSSVVKRQEVFRCPSCLEYHLSKLPKKFIAIELES